MCAAFAGDNLLLFGLRTQLRSPVSWLPENGAPAGVCRPQELCGRPDFSVRPISSGDSLSPHRSCQSPLAPRALPRFIATMGLSDSPAANARLMDSAHASLRFWRSQRRGSPSLPNPTFPARCPHRPRRSPPLHAHVASRWMMASASLTDWPTSPSVTRLTRVCLCCGSQVRSTELQHRNCSRRCPLLYMLDVQLA